MIQIVKLRRGISFLNINVDRLEELFSEPNDVVRKIPEKERFNIYYTLAHHREGERNKESFKKQSVIPFDIDDIDTTKINEYLPLIEKALKVDLSKCAVVASGNGLHVLVKVKEFSNVAFFTRYKKAYGKLCHKINTLLLQSKLSGKADTVVFEHARVFRMPCTNNIKDNKTKACTLLNAKLELQELELTEVKEEANPDEIEQYGRIDDLTVMEECLFLKWCKESPAEVSEPLWYAMLSITARFEDGGKMCHAISAGHPSYKPNETDQKIEHAISGSNPRTCKSINSSWGGCEKCQHWGRLRSPVLISGENFIATEFCGFTTIGPKGGITRQHKDLVKFYNREHPFVNVKNIKATLVFNGTHYEEACDKEILNFAQQHFKPVLESSFEANEFLKLLKRENFRPMSFILDRETAGQVNLKNGIFDMNTKALIPHSPEYGFRSVFDIEYVTDTPAPEHWIELLQNVTCGKQEHIDLIEEFIAYALSNLPYTFNCVLIFSGTGDNGKTTLVNCITNFLGFSNVAAMDTAQLNKDTGRAHLTGKMINVMTEASRACFKGDSYFKKLTGNDPVNARYLYDTEFEFVNKAKFLMTYNEMPHLEDISKGMLRRLYVIPFLLDYNEHPEKKIKQVEAKVRLEHSAILNRILAAYKRLLDRGGFKKDKAITDEVEEMRLNSSPFEQFWKEYTVVTCDENDKVPLENLYELYQREMEKGRSNSQFNIGYNGFCKKISHKCKLIHGIKNTRAYINKVQVRCLTGIRLQDFADSIPKQGDKF